MTPEPSPPAGDARRDRSGPGGLPSLPGRPGWPRSVVWGLIALALLALVLAPSLTRSKSDAIDYTAFRDNVTKGLVAKIDVTNESSHITGRTTNGKTFTTTGPAKIPDEDLNLFREKNVQVDFHGPSSNLLGSILIYALPIGLLLGFWFWMGRRAQGQMAGIMSIGRSKAKVYNTEKPKTTFADVAGYPGVKQEISEVVEFLKETQKFRDIGARIPKGVLLVGPPGTGKTLIARAVAGEAGVPFMSITGSDFMEMFVGVGAARVRDLFQTARKQAPCIIFVDELDSIGRKRGAGLGGGHDEREQTLNQLLVEMDGFETSVHVIVIAATNRPDVLDPALLRPGRFDRHVMLDRADIRGRRAILEVHSRNKPLDPSVELEVLAKQTPGFSGADLANLINEGAILAARNNRKVIIMHDLEEAIARVIAGPERKSRMISPSEKSTIAFHEMGHAMVGMLLEHTDPVHKISVVSRGMALGWTLSLPGEDKYLVSKAELEDQLAQILGGRCAEELIL
ncbi:MAG: ATP-dependent zinc metalloprotease FtsH, partial [Actinomycetota bacterium]|nr:ATP-dependent zinc metalloprotease FtsH [Actinomycetota bacterium]